MKTKRAFLALTTMTMLLCSNRLVLACDGGGGPIEYDPIAESRPENTARLLNQAVTFDGTYSYEPGNYGAPHHGIVEYIWNFGDNGPVYVENEMMNDGSFDGLAVHTYTATGTYTTTLTVIDDYGSACDTGVIKIKTTNASPAAEAGVDQFVDRYLTVLCDGSGSSDPDGDVLSYVWKFGDTGMETPPSLSPFCSRGCENTGRFTVTLTVSDGIAEAGDTFGLAVGPGTEADCGVNPAIVTSTQPAGGVEFNIHFNTSMDPSVEPTVEYVPYGGTGQPCTGGIWSENNEKYTVYNDQAITTSTGDGPAPVHLSGGREINGVEIKPRVLKFGWPPRDFTIDTIAPAINITYPPDGSCHKTSPITVSGYAVDPTTPPAATVNSRPVALGADGRFSTRITFTGEGPYDITAAGVDEANNRRETSIGVTYDTVAPEIHITSPSVANVNASRVAVSGTINDDTASVTVNGIRAEVVAGGFSVNEMPLTEGQNLIRADAWDRTGNSSSDEITVNSGTLTDPVTLTASTLSGVAPLAVEFSVETDVEGAVTGYQWDFTGRGSYVSGGITASHTYSEEGIYHPAVRITTSPGVQYTDSLNVNVHHEIEVVHEILISQPVDLALDKDHRLYVLSQTQPPAIGKYDENGNELAFAVLNMINNPPVNSPSGIAVEENGSLYVTDTGNHRIIKLKSDLTLDTIFGAPGTENGRFDSPYGIAAGENGSLYVTETGNNRIQKFAGDRKFICKWGIPGTDPENFNQPKGIAVDNYNQVYVADSGNNRVQKFSSLGSLDASFGRPGSSDDQFNQPVDVAMDSNYNDIIVADRDNNKVKLFKKEDLSFDLKIGQLAGYGNLASPRAVIADRDLQYQVIYVADTGHNRVLKLRLDRLAGTTPEDVWNDMRSHLSAGDVNGALEDFTGDSRETYYQLFNLLRNKLGTIAGDLQPIQKIYVKDETAKYRIRRMKGDREITSYIYFFKDEKGNWKIKSF